MEHASAFHPHGGRDAEIRSRARNAPAWMKRRIDADRQRRGMRPLWASGEAARQRASAMVKDLRAFIAAKRAAIAAAGSKAGVVGS